MTFKTLKRTKEERKLILLTITNWLLETVNKWQFEIMTAMFFGILSHGIVQEEDIRLFATILMLGYTFTKLSLDIESLSKIIWRFIKSTIWYTALMIGYSGISNEQVANALLKGWGISVSFYLIIRYVYPKLFRHSLFKKVLNKPYLGIRKASDPLPPKDNFFEDVELKNADERMRLINQKAIQPTYQNILELSFVDSHKQTKLYYGTDVHTHESRREFAVGDSSHLLVFKLYPLGFATPNASYFHWTAFTLELSKQEAFTVEGFSHESVF